MKKYICIAIIGLVLFSCVDEDYDGVLGNIDVNNAPSVPVINAPTNNILCLDNTITFKWSIAIDPQEQPISYVIEISKDNQFSEIEYTKADVLNEVTATLEEGVSYYWRVKAMDSENNSSEFSSTYQFYTEGDGISNHLPFAPVLVSPELDGNVTGNTATLQWSASDVDTEDELSYDIYLGTVNPPVTKVSEDQLLNNYSASISFAKVYYWKVDVKDNQGGVTKGKVWQFKTN